MILTPQQIAEVCYEAERAYGHALGDYTHNPWRFLSPEEQQYVVKEIEKCLRDPDYNWYDGNHEPPSETHRVRSYIFTSVVNTLKTF